MKIRFRIGPFTIGKTGIRFSTWSRGTGVSIPITNRKTAHSFGKVKTGPLSFHIQGKVKKQASKKVPLEYIENKKKTHKQAYEPWTKKLDDNLVKLYLKGKTIQELSDTFGRTNGAIRSRINKLLEE